MDPKTMVECMREDMDNGCIHYDKREMKLVLDRVAELETCNSRLRNELVGQLYDQMLRCSEDAPQGYEAPDADEIEPECGTECKCPLDCAVYQRWLDLTSPDRAGTSDKASDGNGGG
jgi:hypothetical protein